MAGRADSFRLRRVDTGTVLVDVLHVASTIWSRFCGLQLRRPLPPGHGMLLVPCRSIHTMFVRFAIDVLFLSEEGVVNEVRRDVRPWRVVVPRHPVHAVLEMAAGSVDVETGTAVSVESPDGTVPVSLTFLKDERVIRDPEERPC
ncbi:MAG TPA: DUF192 domain-containing protein [Planctomycetaceae bacterium]|nr:DUF192 domain-containing protein [Planctomycetaceae bacterium]HCK53796.1 DUF192 domain-containing protein [Planctomycetaceae bacterium]